VATVDGIRMGVNSGKLQMLASSTSVPVADRESATVVGALMPIVPTARAEVAA
jgi:hypothetical protein